MSCYETAVSESAVTPLRRCRHRTQCADYLRDMSIFHTITYRRTRRGARELEDVHSMSDCDCQAFRGGPATLDTAGFLVHRSVTRFDHCDTTKLFRFMTAARGH